MHEIFKQVNPKENKIWQNLGVKKWGVPLKQGQKIQTFQPLMQNTWNFRQSKYYKKIKFDKIWGYQSGGFPLQTGPPKFWTFKPLKLDKSNFRSG